MNTSESDVPRKHRQQLVATGVSAYRLIESVEQAATKGGWSGTFVRYGIILAEALVAEEIAVGDDAVQSVSSITALQPADAEKAWECLALTVSKARPSHAVMKLVISNFGRWLDKVGPTRRDALLKYLSRAQDFLSAIGPNGMEKVLIDLVALPAPKAEDYLGFLTHYTRCPKQAALAIQQFARRAIEWDCKKYLDELLIVLPPESMFVDTDSEHYIVALATMSESCARTSGRAVWDQAIVLALNLGKLSLSTGYYAARSLASVLQTLREDAVPSYLNEFTRLAETVGVGIAGFSLQELPKLYIKYGTERAGNFVALACEIGVISGPHAAVWFLERRTEVSREILPF